MAISKVIYKESADATPEVWMDVTQKTVTSASMLNGVTALKNDGTDITGNIASKTSSDLTVSGATVTAPAGMYSSSASKSVASGSATTPATTVTANPSISVNSSGLITATTSATKSVTPTVSAGYVSSGTAGTITVSGSNTSQLTTQAAQTIYPSTSDQTISSGKYLTGTQTFKGVLLTNLNADNIKKDVVVKIGDSADDDRIASVTGTYEGSGGGGGLEYETGTYTPASDASSATISFVNTHTARPFCVIMADATGTLADTYSILMFGILSWYDAFGSAFYRDEATQRYARVAYDYKTGTSAYQGNNEITSLTGAWDTDGMLYWLSASRFYAYTKSASNQFFSGRTYKWIAVWAPSA